MIRKEILELDKWKYSGSFDDFKLPEQLKSLFRWIITGPRSSLKECSKRKDDIDNSVNILGQLMITSTKTRRQVTYMSEQRFRQAIETPFTVGMGMHIHKTTRNKSLVNMLNNFNLCISYDKILHIEDMLADNVLEESKNHKGAYIPPNINKNERMHFAIDNVDFKNDTPDGKKEFHGTTHVTKNHK